MPQSPARSNGLRQALCVLFLALVLLFLGRFVWRHLDALRAYSFELSPAYLVAGCLVAGVAQVLLFLVWYELTRGFGLPVELHPAMRAWFLSQLGKYVPGKVGPYLVRFHALRGTSGRQVLLATGCEEIVALTSGGLVVLLALLCSPAGLVPRFVRPVAAAGVVTTFVFLLPPVFGRVANLGLRLLRRSPLTSTPGVDLLLRAVGTGVVAGLAGGISFWLILRSLDPTAVQWALAAPVIGLYYASGLVGLLAVFAPAGLGVREGILFVGLSTVLPTPVVITGAILMRLLVTGIDVAGAVAVLGLRTPAGDAGTGTEPPGQGSQS